MWPLPRLSNELVTIVLTPEALTCGWIQAHAKGRSFFSRTAPHTTQPFVLRAYAQTPLEQLQFAQGVLYNPTNIQQHITTFLAQHHLEHAFIALAVSGDRITQKLVTFSNATPSAEQVASHVTDTSRWNTHYLYPSTDKGFTFFVYGIPQEQFLQYKLLAIAAQLNLITLLPTGMAHLMLYHFAHNKPHTYSALEQTLKNASTITQLITQLITQDTLTTLCACQIDQMPAPLTPLYTKNNGQGMHAPTLQDTSELACMLGLFIAGTNL